MKQIIQENVEKLRKAVENKNNLFVKCRSFSEFDVIKDIIFQRRETYPYSLDTKGLIMYFPCWIRIARGEVRELISDDEMKGVSFYDGSISDFVENELVDGHSWKYCGMLDEQYGVGAMKLAKDYAEFYADESENPFIKCFECGKPFKPTETPYQGAFTVKNGVKFRCICRKCAYTMSVKVTDYTLDTANRVEVKEWTK